MTAFEELARWQESELRAGRWPTETDEVRWLCARLDEARKEPACWFFDHAASYADDVTECPFCHIKREHWPVANPDAVRRWAEQRERQDRNT